jgi:hypothetical protein
LNQNDENTMERDAAGSLRVSLSYELPAISPWLIVSKWGTKGVDDNQSADAASATP